MNNLIKEDIIKMRNQQKIKKMCRCGHKIIIPEFLDKRLCDWCGRWVFRTPKLEFQARLKEKMLKK